VFRQGSTRSLVATWPLATRGAMAPRLDCTQCAPSPVSDIDCAPSAAVAAHLAPPLGVPSETAAGTGVAGGGRAGVRKGGRAPEQWEKADAAVPFAGALESAQRRVRSTAATPTPAVAIASHGLSLLLLPLRGRSKGAVCTQLRGSLLRTRALSSLQLRSTDDADQRGRSRERERERGRGRESESERESVRELTLIWRCEEEGAVETPAAAAASTAQCLSHPLVCLRWLTDLQQQARLQEAGRKTARALLYQTAGRERDRSERGQQRRG